MKTILLFRFRPTNLRFDIHRYKNKCGSPITVVTIPFLDFIFLEDTVAYKILMAEYVNQTNYIENLVEYDRYRDSIISEAIKNVEDGLDKERRAHSETRNELSYIKSSILNLKYSIRSLSTISKELDSALKEKAETDE